MFVFGANVVRYRLGTAWTVGLRFGRVNTAQTLTGFRRERENDNL